MSDLGTYAAIETELYTALTTDASPLTATGAETVTVVKTLSLTDLIMRDAFRKPAVGILHAGSEWSAPYSVSTRYFRAKSLWGVAIVVDSLRGGVDNRGQLYELLEQVRDRVHFLTSARSPKACFMFSKEEYIEQPRQDLLAVLVTFSLDLILGI